MAILALDPGPVLTAWMVFDGQPIRFGIETTGVVLESMRTSETDAIVACECLQCFGMPVGKETFETAYWIGRFMEIAGSRFVRVYRSEVKMHLCHNMRAKDGNIRQALLDKFGGKANAIGTKKQPGPLYGVSSHAWSALAVAVTASETKL